MARRNIRVMASLSRTEEAMSDPVLSSLEATYYEPE